MLRVLIRAGPTTCLRHTVPVPARTGTGLQEGKRRSVRPRAGPKVHTGTTLPSDNSESRGGWRWRAKPPAVVSLAEGWVLTVAIRYNKLGNALSKKTREKSFYLHRIIRLAFENGE
jgi:hypothetical protein